jgi:nucleotide-binding universal stress UspA family protein
MKKILFPTDFSEQSQVALPHAINMAALEGGELHLLYVVVLHGPTSPLMDEFSGEEEARAALDGLKTGETRVVHAVRRAIAASPAILDYAAENDVDMIVMGSHGRRGFRRLLLGSVTEEVIRAGRWPVLTIRSSPEAKAHSPNYAMILAPVDFSAHSELGVKAAADLARRFSGQLSLVHVIDIPIIPEIYGPVAAPAVDAKRAAAQAGQRLSELAERVAPDIDVQTEVRVGGAAHEILEAAEEREADLIVLPTHGFSGLDRLLMGSVTEAVLRRAECPVLTLKPKVD